MKNVATGLFTRRVNAVARLLGKLPTTAASLTMAERRELRECEAEGIIAYDPATNLWSRVEEPEGLTREQMELYTPQTTGEALATRTAVIEINEALASARRQLRAVRASTPASARRIVERDRIWLQVVEPVLEAHRKTGAHDTASRERIFAAYVKK